MTREIELLEPLTGPDAEGTHRYRIFELHADCVRVLIDPTGGYHKDRFVWGFTADGKQHEGRLVKDVVSVLLG